MAFDSFFERIHGYSPFPWQSEAARRLLDVEPLDTVVVPTGMGKTAMLDATIYHAMHGGPQRIFFIIDRRVVVDEAYERALRIQEKIAERFPVRVIRLRGGVQGDQDWVWHPEETLVVLSTVDQVGSRLLFRGYGVAPKSWPMHAAMVGNRAVYIVDEAHQSRPFATTVRAAISKGADIRLIEMTATPGQSEGSGLLGLSQEDLVHPLVDKRLSSHKLAKLDVIGKSDKEFAAAVSKHAQVLAKPGAVVGIVANTVKAARAVHETLSRDRDTVLLIGRNRPYDRDRLMAEHFDRMRAGRVRANDGEPLFVVATQTIEVGADIDFDALVTEAAPLSALRQRFGRVDRLGELGETRNTVVARETAIDEGTASKTLVYGLDVRAAWQWLESIAADGLVDFGLFAMGQALSAHPPPTETEAPCPALLPSHVHALSQTGRIAPQISVAPWLHGPDRPSKDINIVWRADLHIGESDTWEDRVRILPPVTRESVQVPLRSLKDVLTHRMSADFGDSEGDELPSMDAVENDLPFLIWRGSDDVSITAGADVRPGDTIVLPASYGGLDVYGWHPKSTDAVADIAEQCVERHVRRLPRNCPEACALIAALDAVDDDDQAEQVAAAESALFEAEEGPRGYTRIGDDLILIGKIVQEQAGGLTAGVAVTLEDHHAGVAAKAQQLAEDVEENDTVVAAAAVHDAGKKAPAFQAMLYGDLIAAAIGPLLAKSGLRDPQALRASYTASGLPRGFRHELYSVDLTPDAAALERHLIGTHHGHGRPWFPACADPDAPGAHLARLDMGWAEQFDQLHYEKNPWHLADLEHRVRASDIQRTVEEQELQP